MSTFTVPSGGPSTRWRRPVRPSPSVAAVVAIALTLGMLSLGVVSAEPASADTAPSGTTPATVSADLLPTPQIDGVAWDQIVIGDTVFVGGKFDSARPFGAKRGENETPRSSFLAYDLASGKLRTDVAPAFNGQIRSFAVSPDKKRLYVGGEFTTVDGKPHQSLAAFDISSPAHPKLTLSEAFRPATSGRVQGVSATNTSVYVGGKFLKAYADATNMNTNTQVERRNAAAFASTDGTVEPWAPAVGDPTKLDSSGKSFPEAVTTLVVSPAGDKVILGGPFRTLNDVSTIAMGAVDAQTGTTNLTWKIGRLVPTPENYDPKKQTREQAMGDASYSAYSLESDGTYVYGAMFPGGYEGTFKASWKDGTIGWLADCRGDSYSVYPVGDVVYTASHAHNCQNLGDFPETGIRDGSDKEVVPRTYKRALAVTTAATRTVAKKVPSRGNTAFTAYEGQPAPSVLNWYPEFNTGATTGQGPWDVTASDGYVLVGGEFSQVNGVGQEGLARFATTDKTTNTSGPRLSGVDMAPTLKARGGGRGVSGSFTTNYDWDNQQLTYEVYRDGSEKPIATFTDGHRYWQRAKLTFFDNGLAPGRTYSYRVRTIDPLGNATWGDGRSYTVPATTSGMLSMTPYDRTVLDDEPEAYWPFNENSGTASAFDWVGANDLRATPAARTVGVTAAYATDGRAATYRSAQGIWSAASTETTPSRAHSQELWFKTTSSTSSSLMAFTHDRTRASTYWGRQIYMDGNGRVYYSPYPSAQYSSAKPAQNALYTGRGLNDGKWHHVVAVTSSSGSTLYVDGRRADSSATMNGRQAFDGYWSVGGYKTTNRFVAAPSRAGTFFDGTLDNVAVYSTAMDSTSVSEHYSAGKKAVNQAPSGAFTASATGVSVVFDGSPSSDRDGSVTGYAWDFGDGSTGTGKTATHAYSKPGSYTVTLTVTDDGGATASVRNTVVVERTGAVAEDSFDRDSGTGWASSEQGGQWTLSPATGFAIDAGRGVIAIGKGETRTALLSGASAASTDSTVSFRIAEKAVGPQYVSVIGRQVGGSTYSARVVVQPDGKLQLQLFQSGTQLGGTFTAGTYTAGQTAQVRLQVSAPVNGVTTVNAKVWTSAAEPASWGRSATDATSALQAPGAVGMKFYVAGSGAATTVSVDDYRATSID